ncbi:hypothetical protein Taro_011053 [Colocasia esculenta]|uniref:IBH1-like N-terminal domain-containing protein n=1 Tax=Colocasia esculenta TaxID=4460 RepID=A0A843UBH9_COLES|nr:hypothetical protein [Colocasia esculenta]
MKEINSHHQLLYTFETSHVMIMLANFSHNYVAYLLPALLKLSGVGSCRGNKSMEFEKLVRFEVDMALVLSASGFAWSHALKQKLEQGANTKKKGKLLLYNSPTKQLVSSSTLPSTCSQKNIALNMVFAKLWTSPFIARPLPPTSTSPMAAKRRLRFSRARKPKGYCSTSGSGRMLLREDDQELRLCMRSLRSVVPAGSEMGVRELLSEVESYVVCLELQVSILRSLLK